MAIFFFVSCVIASCSSKVISPRILPFFYQYLSPLPVAFFLFLDINKRKALVDGFSESRAIGEEPDTHIFNKGNSCNLFVYTW